MKLPPLYLEANMNAEALITLPFQSKCTICRREERAMAQRAGLSKPGKGIRFNRGTFKSFCVGIIPFFWSRR